MQHGPGMHGGLVGTMIILGVILAGLGFVAWKIVLNWRLHRRNGAGSEETNEQVGSQDSNEQGSSEE